MRDPTLSMTEKEFREQIRDLCKLFGWKFHFTWLAIHSPKGFPDLVLRNVEQKRIVFAELKTERGIITPSQQEWHDDLIECGQEAYIWRPSDLETIASILQNAAAATRLAVTAQEKFSTMR